MCVHFLRSMTITISGSQKSHDKKIQTIGGHGDPKKSCQILFLFQEKGWVEG